MDRLLLPPRYRVYQQNGQYLYFDSHNFVWIKVNESGHFLLQLLTKYLTVSDLIHAIASRFAVSENEASQVVSSFTAKLIASGFLHRNVYRERQQTPFAGNSFPHSIYLHLTNKCSLKCPYCYNKTDRETKIKLEKKGLVSPTMSTAETKDLIRDVVSYGVKGLMFTGGEPLLHRDAMALVAFAREQSDARVRQGGEPVELQMLTNAILISEQVTGQMCELLDIVTISLDGHEEHA